VRVFSLHLRPRNHDDSFDQHANRNAEFNTMMAYFADKHYAGDIEVVTPSEFVKLAA